METPDLGKALKGKTKTKRLLRDTELCIEFFEEGRYFYKKYSCEVKKTQSKEDVQGWLKTFINEADCQLYANGIMHACNFRTPLMYRVYFDVSEDDEFTFSVVIQMERIDLSEYKIGQKFSHSDLERLAPIEQCLTKHKIVHDDLAPRNVGIKDDEILLIDWGESFFGEKTIHTQNRNHANLNGFSSVQADIGS